MDASGLITRSNRLSADDVLNGIAYVVERDTFFLTGKHWPKLFEISNPLSVRADSSQHA
jgi:glutaminyl-peptide cyclotransferase